MGIEIFQKHLRENRAIKFSISDKENDLERIANIFQTIQQVKGSAIDIPANKEIYNLARKNTKLPIFTSSIHPFDILNAVKLGVDGIQIGNYFEVYKNDKELSANNIYDIMLETLGLISGYNVFTCVTIPSNLSLVQQKELLEKCEVFGVDLIQVEGYTKTKAIAPNGQVSIKNFTKLTEFSRLPIMVSCIENISDVKQAFELGASAINVEVDKYKSNSVIDLKMGLLEIVQSIYHRNSLNREIVRTYRELTLN